MGGHYVASPFAFLISTVFEIYAMVVLLRFFLQLVRASFYNPLSQGIVSATNPLLKPLRNIVPGFAGQDMAALVLAYLIMVAKLLLLSLLFQVALNPVSIGIVAFVDVITATISLFTYAIFIEIILSWLNPQALQTPIGSLIGQLNGFILRPIRQILPQASMIDFAPMVALLGLQFVKMFITPLAGL